MGLVVVFGETVLSVALLEALVDRTLRRGTDASLALLEPLECCLLLPLLAHPGHDNQALALEQCLLKESQLVDRGLLKMEVVVSLQELHLLARDLELETVLLGLLKLQAHVIVLDLLIKVAVLVHRALLHLRVTLLLHCVLLLLHVIDVGH